MSNLLKLQSQMTKELLEAGLQTIVTHTCTDCALHLCLLCSLIHKQKHPNHTLKQVISKSSLQALTKKGNNFEQLLTNLGTERVKDQIDCEANKLITTMKQVLKI